MEKSVAIRRLEEAKAQLEKVEASYERALAAQSWQTQNGMDRRSVENANITSLFNQVLYWRKEVERLESLAEGRGGSSFRIGLSL